MPVKRLQVFFGKGDWRSMWFGLMLVILASCSSFPLEPTMPPNSTQELNATQIATPSFHLNDGIILTDTQELVNNVTVLCCEDGWWAHLFNAENNFSDLTANGEENDIGALFLENLEMSGERFDPNKYFEVLTHLSLADGYVLDYVYFAPGGDGFPQLYARKKDAPAFTSYLEFQETYTENYLHHVQLDGTVEGFFELALLEIVGEQFYLAWHAGYNDWEVVSSSEKLEEIIEWLDEDYRPLTEEQVRAISQIDVAPTVKFEGDKVLVQILVFTKWGGFYERLYTIDREFPHQMIKEDFQLIPYNCGTIF